MKKLLVIFLCLALVVSVAACGSKQQPSQEPGKTPAENPSNNSGEKPSTGEKGLIGISVPEAPTGWVAAIQWAADRQQRDLESITALISADENTQANHIDGDQLGCKTIVRAAQRYLGTATRRSRTRHRGQLRPYSALQNLTICSRRQLRDGSPWCGLHRRKARWQGQSRYCQHSCIR